MLGYSNFTIDITIEMYGMEPTFELPVKTHTDITMTEVT